jgi:DNA-binding response OmpR family regulator
VSDRNVVLLASSDEGVHSQVRLTLGTASYEVHTAEDTNATVRALAAVLPRLLIVDLALPGGGALAIARTIRTEPETAGIATLALVGRGEDAPASAPGVDATLALPNTSLALLGKVESLLRVG